MTYISESVFQYACKANYNTETALVKVQNAVLRALNGQQSVLVYTHSVILEIQAI